MRKVLLTLAALALASATATAGPIRNAVGAVFRRPNCPPVPVQGTVPPPPAPAVPTHLPPGPGGVYTASYAVAFVPPTTCGPAGCPR